MCVCRYSLISYYCLKDIFVCFLWVKDFISYVNMKLEFMLILRFDVFYGKCGYGKFYKVCFDYFINL